MANGARSALSDAHGRSHAFLSRCIARIGRHPDAWRAGSVAARARELVERVGARQSHAPARSDLARKLAVSVWLRSRGMAACVAPGSNRRDRRSSVAGVLGAK